MTWHADLAHSSERRRASVTRDKPNQEKKTPRVVARGSLFSGRHPWTFSERHTHHPSRTTSPNGNNNNNKNGMCRCEGFLFSDHADEFDAARAELAALVADGRLAYRHDVAGGLEASRRF